MGGDIFDVVSQDDVVIDQASRQECHSNNRLLHRTVQFTLFDSTQKLIFLTQRPSNAYRDSGKICFLGKHVRSGETYENTLIRGCHEELNISCQNYTSIGKHIFTSPLESEMISFYLVAFKNGDKFKYSPKDFTKSFWVNLSQVIEITEQLSDMTQYWLKIINNYLNYGSTKIL